MKKWLIGMACVGMLAVTAMGQVATLPTSHSGPWTNAFLPTGWVSGLGSGNDYANYDSVGGGAARFDNTGETLTINFDSAPGEVSYWIRANTLSGAYVFKVEESADASTWTDVMVYNGSGIPTTAAPATNALLNSSRHVRFNYVNKDLGNVGVDGILITAGSTVFSVTFDKANGFSIEQGASDAVTATAANGTAPYGYVWSSTLDGAYYSAVDNVFTILATAPIGDYLASVTATDASLATTSNGLNFSVAAPAVPYAITIAPPVNGTVTTTPETQAIAGATVTVNATPAGGYAVASITVVDGAMNPVTVTGNTFVMPASAATVTVVFGVAPDFALDFSDVPTIAYADVSTTANGVALDIAQCYRDVNAPDYMIRMRWISTNAGYFGNATAFTNGSISKMTFQYKAYGASHTNYQFIVQFKTAGGEWTQVGGTYLASNVDWVTAEVLSVPAGATFFRIQSVAPESGTVIKTGNFDNFGFWFGEAAYGVTFDQTSGFTIEEGTTDVITAAAANGVAPYSYTWTSSLGESYRTIANDQLTILATAPVGDYTAQVVATDSDTPAKSVTNSLNFSVAAPATMYAIAITPPVNGTVTTTPATEAAAGATVTVNATPAGGYAVQSIVVNGGAVAVSGTAPYTFTMPAEPATVTVTFQESSASGELIISQYYEGASNNKWIEIYNPGSSAVDLLAGGYRLGVWANANRELWKSGTAPGGTVTLSNSIPAGGTYVVGNTGVALPAYVVANQLSGSINFTGDDSVVLYTGSTYSYANVVDAFGLIANAAQDKSFVRKDTVTAGVNTDFNAADWDEFSNAAVDAAAESTNERLGYHSTGPAVFSVSLNRANGFTIEQGASDAITATAANGTAPYGYAWTSSLGSSFYTTNAGVFTILATAPVGDYSASVTATDNAAQTASNSVTFSVVAPAVKYAITITPPANGTVTTTPATEAAAGTTVTVNATPIGDYAVESIVVNGGAVTVTGTTFVMPAEPATVTVTFVVFVAPDVFITFENGTLPSAYSNNTALLEDGKIWSTMRIYKGNADNDKKMGAISARLYPVTGTNAVLQQTEAYAEPITKLSFSVASYGTDNMANVVLTAEVSTDGSSWEAVKTLSGAADITATLTEHVVETIPANAVYARFVATAAAATGKRVNIDNVGFDFGAAVPSLSYSGAATITMGQSFALTFTLNNGTASGWQYTLESAGREPLDSGSANTFNWTPSSAGTYYLTMTALDEAVEPIATREVTLTVNSLNPVDPAVIVAGSRSGTVGVEMALTISITNETTIGDEWYIDLKDPDGLDDTSYGFDPPSFTLTPTKTGTYVLTATAVTGSGNYSNVVNLTVGGGGSNAWAIGQTGDGGTMSTTHSNIMIVLPTNYMLNAVYGSDASASGLNNLGQGLGTLNPGTDYTWTPATRTVNIINTATNRRFIRIGATP